MDRIPSHCSFVCYNACMRKAIVYALLLTGMLTMVGCSSKQSSPQNTDSGSEYVGWHMYENNKYGVAFRYPADWSVSVSENAEILDIHLANNVSSTSTGSSGLEWSLGKQEMEMQIGHEKDVHQDFDSFIASKLSEGGMGDFGGPILPFTVEGIQVRKIQDSGWDSGVSGPGYFLEQDSGHYTYIFSGSKSDDYGTIESIIRSVRFVAPSK